MRFGLCSDGREYTLEEVGRYFDVTRERVRQIESQAKKALATLNTALQPAAAIFANIFQEHGGILSQDHAVKLIGEHFSDEQLPASHIYFI